MMYVTIFSPVFKSERYTIGLVSDSFRDRLKNRYKMSLVLKDDQFNHRYYSLPSSIILFPLTIAQLIITTFISIIDSIFFGLNILTKNKLKPVFKIFYYAFISVPAILYLITTEAKWFLYNFVQIHPSNQTKFYAYTAVLLPAALAIIALSTANILPLANIAFITTLLTVLLIAISSVVKIYYRAIHDDQKLHACWPFIAMAGIYAGLVMLHEAELINIAFMLHPGAIITVVAAILSLSITILLTSKNKIIEEEHLSIDCGRLLPFKKSDFRVMARHNDEYDFNTSPLLTGP